MLKQKGFTLVELIVVIVILGILAATALPKFVDLSSDARGGVMKGVEASMRSANLMLYGKAAAADKLSGSATVSATSTVAVELKNGYAKDAGELYKIMDLNPASDFLSSTSAIQHAKASTPASCEVSYSAPGAPGGTASYSATLTGC